MKNGAHYVRLLMSSWSFVWGFSSVLFWRNHVLKHNIWEISYKVSTDLNDKAFSRCYRKIPTRICGIFSFSIHWRIQTIFFCKIFCSRKIVTAAGVGHDEICLLSVLVALDFKVHTWQKVLVSSLVLDSKVSRLKCQKKAWKCIALWIRV